MAIERTDTVLSSGTLLSFTLAVSQAGLRERFHTGWDQLLQIGLDLIFVVILFLVARYVAKFIQRFIWRQIPIYDVTPATESLVNNSTALALYATAFTLALAFLGASWSTLLTAFSVSTIAVIFGLADLLKSLLGGAFLIFERPYEVGDRIKIRDNEGEVTEIGVRTTTLLTDDRATVIIPNSLHLSEPFRNFDRATQVASVIRITDIESDPDTVDRQIKEVLATDPPIEARVTVTMRSETGFVDRIVANARRPAHVAKHREIETRETVRARIQLKGDHGATSRDVENDALIRLRAAFPDAIVSIRRSSLIEDERRDVD